MAEMRNIVLSRTIINSMPLVAEVEGYSPPDVKKKTEETKGGRFVSGEATVGLEPLKGKLVLVGATADLLNTFEIEVDSYSEITVLASTLDELKNKTPLRYEHTCEITSATCEEIKPGAYKYTLEFVCRAYTFTDNGKVVFDIDVPTQKAVLFGKDMMEKHRANVEMA